MQNHKFPVTRTASPLTLQGRRAEKLLRLKQTKLRALIVQELCFELHHCENTCVLDCEDGAASSSPAPRPQGERRHARLISGHQGVATVSRYHGDPGRASPGRRDAAAAAPRENRRCIRAHHVLE